MPDSKENTASPSRQASEGEPKWKLSATADLGSNLPQAMLICDGLLGMCFTGTKCEIGFLAVPANGDPLLERHQPEITVVAVYSDKRAEILFQRKWPRETPTFQTATLTVTNPTDGNPFPRFFLKSVPDERDFSKGVDLEHDLNGGGKLNIESGAFKPRIQVEQGDFHSLLLTPEEYEAVPDGHSGPVIHLGRIAYMTAANLHCDPTAGAVVLNIDNGMGIHSWSVRDRRIFVIIHNNCQEHGKKCVEDSPDGTTDFHLYYRAMSRPNKYKINCKGGKPTSPNFNLLHEDVRRALCKAELIPSEFCKSFDRSLLREHKNITSPFLVSINHGEEITRKTFLGILALSMLPVVDRKVNFLRALTTNPTPCGIGGFGESNSLEGS
ncbi:MAG: hypothetical protein ACREA2_04915 [Blastocatellia bacterium]